MPSVGKEKKIGILGGTFDPVHIGHLLVAQDAREALGLARVVFVPAASPPHKMAGAIAPGSARFEMIQLAIRDNPAFSVSDVEFRRSGHSFSVDMVDELGKELGEVDLHFLIGEDNLKDIWSWKEPERLFRICRIVVIGRAGNRREQGPLELPGPVLALDIHRIVCSSSEIRSRVQRGESIRYLVPPDVERYIYDHRLYH